MNLSEITEIRKYLHQHPELSGKEIETSKYIKKTLSELLPDAKIVSVAEVGIIATISGNKNGKHVILRCELDALPIHEINQFKHQSTTKNVSHKCGHDGHMAILLAVANYFNNNKPKKGTLSLLFQPSEENGEGAKSVISDSFFKSLKPDYIFALHNVPGYQKHKIFYKEKTFTPSVISVKIKLIGKTAHAAEPENGINPSYAIAELLQKTKELEHHNKKSNSYGIITPVYTKIGSEDYGISVGYGEVDFTIRTWKKKHMEKLREDLLNLIIDISLNHHLKYSIDWFQEFNAVENNTYCVQLIKKAAELNNFNHVEKSTPFPWGEDFGLFTEQIAGAMFCLGAGKNTPSLHNPDYDFPDDLIKTGSEMFILIFNTAQE
jgi:amidohydrolase